jgi:calcineurin-like phosphoesterase family protein
MIYFISDAHFGHQRCAGYCHRPFQETKEMDDAILDGINSIVKPKDTLYFLGDFCHKGGKPKKYREQIACQNVHLILGNHDNEKYCSKYFKSISLIKEIVYAKQKIILCHYPMRAWHKSYKDSWMLYGHVHSRLHKEDEQLGRLTLDVGVDNTVKNGKVFGSPWSFSEIQKLFKDRVSIHRKLSI